MISEEDKSNLVELLYVLVFSLNYSELFFLLRVCNGNLF